eukprot:TRINITY_DN2153_c0_g1_i1.p1 TRINITY_DN2153_c0_g1~~TRINITY_DN2153_c0_g1_i1.p1  ORF type:complete len:584 (-),score=89.91 TRINITY_DN2153_c0_g1_i1:168-1919(-)
MGTKTSRETFISHQPEQENQLQSINTDSPLDITSSTLCKQNSNNRRKKSSKERRILKKSTSKRNNTTNTRVHFDKNENSLGIGNEQANNYGNDADMSDNNISPRLCNENTNDINSHSNVNVNANTVNVNVNVNDNANTNANADANAANDDGNNHDNDNDSNTNTNTKKKKNRKSRIYRQSFHKKYTVGSVNAGDGSRAIGALRRQQSAPQVISPFSYARTGGSGNSSCSNNGSFVRSSSEVALSKILSTRVTVEKEYFFKVIVVGSAAVGKSSLLLRLTEDKFFPSYVSTIGIDFKIHTLRMYGCRVRLQIGDCSSQDRYKYFTTSYMKEASCVVVVFDVTDPNSLEKMSEWSKKIVESDNLVYKFLVGNKCDFDISSRAFSEEEVRQYASQNGYLYYETNCKDGCGIQMLFQDISEQLLQHNQENVYQSFKLPSLPSLPYLSPTTCNRPLESLDTPTSSTAPSPRYSDVSDILYVPYPDGSCPSSGTTQSALNNSCTHSRIPTNTSTLLPLHLSLTSSSKMASGVSPMQSKCEKTGSTKNRENRSGIGKSDTTKRIQNNINGGNVLKDLFNIQHPNSPRQLN